MVAYVVSSKEVDDCVEGEIKDYVLLDKPEGRKVNIVPKYCGGKVPNAFVVGYGLDYDEHYRNLPYLLL